MSHWDSSLDKQAFYWGRRELCQRQALGLFDTVRVCVCVFVVCVKKRLCVSLWERECVCLWGRDCVCVWGIVLHSEWCACVCVCKRDIDLERENRTSVGFSVCISVWYQQTGSVCACVLRVHTQECVCVFFSVVVSQNGSTEAQTPSSTLYVYISYRK